MGQIVPLESLRPGERGRILEIDGLEHLVHRLAEMGLREGAVVTMLQTGSPCILDLNQHRLSFRVDDSASVLVEIPA
jgi:ferrous iron transport protein A